MTWGSVFRNSGHPQDFLWLLATIPVCQNNMGLPRTCFVIPHFLFGFGTLVGFHSDKLFWCFLPPGPGPPGPAPPQPAPPDIPHTTKPPCNTPESNLDESALEESGMVIRPHTALTVLVYPHFRLTRLLEGDLSDQSPLKMSMGVEVEELEEDLEWSISCLKGVIDVWRMRTGGRTRW